MSGEKVEEKREIEVKPLPVALQRLVDEVKQAEEKPSGYNRTYHRHNRS